MRILVTGAAGFVGRYMLAELTAHGHAPVALDRHEPVNAPPAEWRTCDVLDREALEGIVRDTRPEACIHLAGVSFVPDGIHKPGIMLTINASGTLNLLDVFREGDSSARLLCVSTAQVYGSATGQAPVLEDTPLRPVSRYAVSKGAADLAALGYADAYGMNVLTVRPNNHTGPGQSDRFVVPGLIAQARAIAAGHVPPVIHAGNMESRRDFTDVRDVVRAYRLLLERGAAGQAYNVGSGRTVPIGDVLARINKRLGIAPEIAVDPAKFRPTDQSPLVNTARIESQTGWRPALSLSRTLEDMIAAPATKHDLP